MGRVNKLALAVSIALDEYSKWPVFFMDSLHLAGYNLRSFLPRNPLELALAPVLRVPLSLGIPVNPL
jgi:hypothetical protein